MGIGVDVAVGAVVGVGSSEQEAGSNTAMAANAVRAVKRDILEMIFFI